MDEEVGAGALIVTARFDGPAQHHFQAMRDRYFPPERNMVPAHCTLFHKLPGARLDDLIDALEAARPGRPPLVSVTGILPFRTGGAYRIECESLRDIRAHVADVFADDLTRQDSQPWRPHVTFQNKADPDTAARTLRQVERNFEPFTTTLEGIDIWYWRGGPWEHAATVPLGALPQP